MACRVSTTTTTSTASRGMQKSTASTSCSRSVSRRIHHPRARSGQACVVRKADGLDRRRMRTDGRRRRRLRSANSGSPTACISSRPISKRSAGSRPEQLGALRYVQCDHGFNANPEFPPHKWRLEKKLAGGGSMFDIGIYGLNTALMMLGDDLPVEVSAVYSYPRDDARFKEVEGGIDWRLRTQSGISVRGSSSPCYSPYTVAAALFRCAGFTRWNPPRPTIGNTIVIEGGGQPRREIGAGSPLSQFASQIDGFSEAARANKPHRTAGEMGLQGSTANRSDVCQCRRRREDREAVRRSGTDRACGPRALRTAAGAGADRRRRSTKWSAMKFGISELRRGASGNSAGHQRRQFGRGKGGRRGRPCAVRLRRGRHPRRLARTRRAALARLVEDNWAGRIPESVVAVPDRLDQAPRPPRAKAQSPNNGPGTS